IEPARIQIVGDDPSELEAALREGLGADLCAVSGGLGPTHDDRTVELLARATGRELAVGRALEAEIEAVSRGGAERPRRPSADFMVLVGPRSELRRRWPQALETSPVRSVLARAREPEGRVLRFYGASESAVARALAEAGGEAPGLAVTVCARDFEIHVDLVFEAEASSAADRLGTGLRERLGEYLFAEDERPGEELGLAACL